MKNKPGPKSTPVDKLRTLCIIAALDRLAPNALKTEETKTVGHWRAARRAMSKASLNRICNRIKRSSDMGGQATADKIKSTFETGPNGLPLWEAFDLSHAHTIPIYFAEKFNIDARRLSPAEAAQAVVKAPAPELWKLAATTGAFFYYWCYTGPDPETELRDHPDVEAILLNILPKAEPSLEKIGITTQQWAECMRDQIPYLTPHPQTLVASLLFDKAIIPACTN